MLNCEEGLQSGLNAKERRKLKRIKEGRGIDFLLDDRTGSILTKESSGFSTFNREDQLPSSMQKEENRPNPWQLKRHTPFLSEMNISDLNPVTGHASIKPRSDIAVSPETFRKMLNCLHWVKLYPKPETKE